MSKTNAQDITEIRAQVIQSSLDLAAKKSWSDVSFSCIAKKANIPLQDVMAIFPEKMDIVMSYSRQVDVALADAFDGGMVEDDNHKDQLFDIIMERFDILNENRDGVISIINSLTLDPKQSIASLPFIYQSMSAIFDLIGADINGWKGTLQITGLGVIYLKTLRDWVMDESSDMAQTMASLDKSLSGADQLLGKFNF